MKTFVTVPAVSLLLLAASASIAQESPILGLPFGRVLDRAIPQCLNSVSTGDDYCSLRKEIDHTAPPLAEIVMAPSATKKFNVPEWVITSKQMFISFTRDGTLVGIEADTVGPDQQDRVIGSIKERYGAPTSKVDREVQNGYGAKWMTSTVRWDRPEMVIRFDCIDRLVCRVKFKSHRLDSLERGAGEKKTDKL